jgi:acetyl esterase
LDAAIRHRVFDVLDEDCYAALVWAANNASMLGIDSGRMAVGGSSAGATLAAAVAATSRMDWECT